MAVVACHFSFCSTNLPLQGIRAHGWPCILLVAALLACFLNRSLYMLGKWLQKSSFFSSQLLFFRMTRTSLVSIFEIIVLFSISMDLFCKEVTRRGVFLCNTSKCYTMPGSQRKFSNEAEPHLILGLSSKFSKWRKMSKSKNVFTHSYWKCVLVSPAQQVIPP